MDEQQGGVEVGVQLAPVQELGREALEQAVGLAGIVGGTGCGQTGPLHHGRFGDGRGRVSVEFEQLRAGGRQGQIETAVEMPVAVVGPGVAHGFPEVHRNGQLLQKFIGNRVRDSFHAQRVQRIGSGQQRIGVSFGQLHGFAGHVGGAGVFDGPVPTEGAYGGRHVAGERAQPDGGVGEEGFGHG